MGWSQNLHALVRAPRSCDVWVCATPDMTAQQLMDVGKKEIAATDEALIRAQRIVADTIEVRGFGNLAYSYAYCTSSPPRGGGGGLVWWRVHREEEAWIDSFATYF